MKILVACEFSGVVREAFRKKGHDAWSCDILDTIRPGAHIQEDVRNVMQRNWDLMIAHPPCTYLCNSVSVHGYIEIRQVKRLGDLTRSCLISLKSYGNCGIIYQKSVSKIQFLINMQAYQNIHKQFNLGNLVIQSPSELVYG
jgi:hypothetical protein